MNASPQARKPAGGPPENGDHLIGAVEVCQLCCVQQQWLTERVQQGLIEVYGSQQEWSQWRFDAFGLRRVRRMIHLELHFDAAPELAALVVDLEQEVARLRGRLGR